VLQETTHDHLAINLQWKRAYQ